MSQAASESRYAVERELGSGGAGTVQLVRDLTTGERVARKKLLRLDGGSVQRLKREFRSLANLHHPNLVKLYDLAQASDGWFLTMEYLDGPDLLTYVNATAEPPDVPRVISAFADLATGVHALHRAGMLHRDLKPNNVLVVSGRVVVLDFGLVRGLDERHEAALRDDLVAGTPAYMAPEQVHGDEQSEASDWYAFGVMLYEALSGYLPFEGSASEILAAKLERDPASLERLAPRIPVDLAQLCERLLRREPQERPSGDAVIALLDSHRENPPDAAPRTLTEISQLLEPRRSTRPPLFGRESEAVMLHDALHEVEAGEFVVVYVHGASGAGKSALVDQFLDGLEQRPAGPRGPAPLVLRGRCYERETMPFKALDGALDSLVQHLLALPDREVNQLLPAHLAELAVLFPVFERLPAIQRSIATPRPRADAIQERKRGELALSELLARLSAVRPLVLFIDDLHWGDLDSARILRWWLQHESLGRVLLLLTYRRDELETSACLQLLLDRKAEPRALERTLALAPLDADSVQAMCRERLGAYTSDEALVARIVREAEGSPFFALQLAGLAQHTRARGAQELQHLTLDELVLQTSALLTPPAQRVLAVLATAGRPMAAELALRVAGAQEDSRAHIHALHGMRLTRTRGSGGERLLEVYHDRVREAVQAALGSGERVRIQSSLLRALEADGCDDADWLHTLAYATGERESALRFGLIAAERASASLAFERAAELYQRCLELTDDSSEGRGELWLKLATALACCARGAAAAKAYLEAAREAAGADSVSLMKLAASHLVRTGRWSEGEALVQRVLAALDLRVPEGEAGLLAAILWERTRLALRGLSHQDRAEHEIAPELLLAIDVMSSFSIETQTYDPLRAALFQLRALRLSLAAGEPRRLARALGTSATLASIDGSDRAGRRADALLDRAERIAHRHDLEAADLYAARAICSYLLGRPRGVIDASRRAEKLYRADVHADEQGDYYQRFAAISARIGALFHLADYARGIAELEDLLQEARATDNTCALLQLTLVQSMADQIQDRAEESLARLQAQRAQLPQGRFGPLHTLFMLAVMRTACASGRYDWARTLLADDWDRFNRSVMRRSGHISALAHASHSRMLLNEHVVLGSQGDPAALVREDLRGLARSPLDLAPPTRTRALARIAILDGERARACELLAESALLFEKAGLRDEAARNRHAHGLVIGGSEGSELCAETQQILQEIGLVNFDRDFLAYFPELQRHRG